MNAPLETIEHRDLIETPNETTHARIIRSSNLETSYTPDGFVNPESFDPRGRNDKAYVVLNAGYVLAIVFSEYDRYSEQDALDEAADHGKLDGLQITESELKDFEVKGAYQDWTTGDFHEAEYEGIIYLGNASEPFASESLDIWEVSAIRTFGDDPALMTLERVQTRLDDWLYTAEQEYKATPVDSPLWLPAYERVDALKDALTLCRFASTRQGHLNA